MKKITKKNKLVLKASLFFYKKKKILTLFLSLKSFKTNLILLDRLKSFYNLKLSKFPKKSHLNRFKKNCLLSNRTHGVYSLFCLSRLKIKELA
jgi:ribosomal protein S14